MWCDIAGCTNDCPDCAEKNKELTNEQDMKDKEYLYLEHEKQVLQLAKEAIELIQSLALHQEVDYLSTVVAALKWLKEHE